MFLLVINNTMPKQVAKLHAVPIIEELPTISVLVLTVIASVKGSSAIPEPHPPPGTPEYVRRK